MARETIDTLGTAARLAVSQPEHEVLVEKNVLIPTRDGVELAADVYRPRAPGRFPALLTMLPYRKDDISRGSGNQHYFVPRGYAVVNLDMRGTGNSGGRTTSGAFCGPVDQADGYDAVEWIATQPWCDGNVGMTAVSFGWFTTLLTAIHQPPHLRAIVPIYGGVDFYQDWNEGGSMLGHLFAGRYSAHMLALNSSPPSFRDAQGRWLQVWTEHLQQNEPWLFSWLEHLVEDDFWRECSIKCFYDRVRVPTFAIGGWADFNPSDPFALFMGIQAPKRVLVGPWMHMAPSDALPGPRIDYLFEMLRWFDHWLKGIDTGVLDEPPITIFVQEAGYAQAEGLVKRGRWRHESEWPPARTARTRLFLQPGGQLGQEAAAEEDGGDSFAYKPTVGTAAGLVGGVASGIGLPRDQRADEAFSLTYTSQPLDEDVEITGAGVVTLYVSSTAAVAAFVVKLCDVAPDGSSTLITRASLNATHRASHAEPQPLVPDAVYELQITLKATSYVFPRGHRIRLDVAGADFPWLWPTPLPAVNTVHRDARYPSSLLLPVVPKPAVELPAPNLQPSTSPTPVPPATHYTVVQDFFDDSVTTSWGSKADVPLPGDGRFQLRRTISMRVTDRAPEDVLVKAEAETTATHPESVIQVRAKSHVRSDVGSFHANLTLDVTVNGAPYFSRSWFRSFPRPLL